MLSAAEQGAQDGARWFASQKSVSPLRAAHACGDYFLRRLEQRDGITVEHVEAYGSAFLGAVEKGIEQVKQHKIGTI